MDKLLYVAMTGASENMRAQQVRANNLANASTTGFKADFEQARSMRAVGDGMHHTRVFSMAESPGTNVDSATLYATQRPLDIGIDGNGWIAVVDDKGSEKYTRNGSLQLLSSGDLVTNQGNPVMGASGAPIVLPPSSSVNIAQDGTITVYAIGDPATEPSVVDQIKLVNLEKNTFFKDTDGKMRTNDGLPVAQDLTVQVRSGFLESSNVNAVGELTSMISLSKSFEMQIKMMKNAEENSSAAQSILKLS
jgi:flagellar basal-body rod protein FlgF